MKKLMLLVAAGALWLFLAAIPALADGGVHITAVNSGTSTLTADSCAGCHRAHTAQGQYLITATDETALCLTCHGGGSGATTDVVNGVQFVPANATGGAPGHLAGPLLGALRDGGFVNAAIGSANPVRLTYPRGWANGPLNTIYAISTRPKVPAAGYGTGTLTEASSTSAHMHLDAAYAGGYVGPAALSQTMWGSGNATSGTQAAGTTGVSLECTDCHNPHGNGNYRILRPVPVGGAQTLVNIKASYANAQTLVTLGQNSLTVNDTVTLTGVNGLANGTYYVSKVVNGFVFQVSASLGGTAVTTIADNTYAAGAATVLRPSINIADSPTDPNSDKTYPTKNYTILQTKGVQGVNSTFLLYAQDVVHATDGAWNGITANYKGVGVNQNTVAVTSVAASNWITTTGATGVAAGDLVALVGVPGITNGTYTVSSIQSNGTLYNQFKVYGQTATVTASVSSSTVQRLALAGDYSTTGGDYLRRTVPWNPTLVNAGCDNTVIGGSTNLSGSACSTMNDAPNGIPNAIQSGAGKPTSLIGQQAFVDQMSTWCAECHTRYYSNTNENLYGQAPIVGDGALPETNIPIASVTAGGNIVIKSVTGGDGAVGQYSLPSYGDQVTFSGTGTNLDGNTYYVIATGGTAPTAYFNVATTMSGAIQTITGTLTPSTAVFSRGYMSSNSSWGYPRTTYNGTAAVQDPVFTYQHSTASNRACTVCHVAHGSDAVMTGQAIVGNPTTTGGTWSAPTADSRLLKVNNRGTCEMCHDPTGTLGSNIIEPSTAVSGTAPYTVP